MTVITPGAGCSIMSTTTVSTTGVTGALTFLAVFFTVARLGLAFATVRLVAFARAGLRALPRLAEFPLRSFARLCTFDCFLRLAMITPLVGVSPDAYCRMKRQTANADSDQTQVINRSVNHAR